MNKKKAFLIDLDGCVYSGSRLMPGAAAFIARLRQDGKKIIFLSNNSTHTLAELVEKLRRMGIETGQEDILTPLSVCGAFLAEQRGLTSVFVLGTAALRQAVQAAGHTLTEDNAQVVICGRDLDFTYARFEKAGKLLKSGAWFLLTNEDLSHPSEDGLPVPEAGAFAAALTAVTGRIPDEAIGKPRRWLYQIGLQRLGVSAGEAMMIGDNADTDILGGHRAGLMTIHVAPQQAASPPVKPDVYAPDFIELLKIYQ